MSEHTAILAAVADERVPGRAIRTERCAWCILRASRGRKSQQERYVRGAGRFASARRS